MDHDPRFTGGMMKSLMSLLEYVLADASTWCRVSTIRDWKTISERTKTEGLSFLTITLPAFCKDFERSLSDGQVAPGMFLGFKRHSGLPAFLRGFLELVFDSKSGRLLEHPSIDAIFFIRQITLLNKKILLPCSTKREKAAYGRYIECDFEVKAWEHDSQSHEDFLRVFDHVSHVLWDFDLCAVDLKVYNGDLIPKHGPGSTADRLLGNKKFSALTWHESLEDWFPSAEFVIPNHGFHERLDRVDFKEPGNETPSRLISVPKTLKTPRLISIEPACMQYAQQSLLEVLVNQLEGSDYLSGMVGFRDQTPNQRMACSGSADGALATLDLSEASDRVSNQLVLRMLQAFPSLAGAVSACRTQRVDVPGYGIHSVAKFASMGSAVCFPIEAMVFLTAVFTSISMQLNRPLCRKDVISLRSSVRVYGDDIIVPVEYTQSVVDGLETLGLKVNTSKSFWTGKFRESCGKDYYDGQDVSVTYVRRLLPTSQRSASEVISAISLRNQFYKKGLWKSADFLDNYLRKSIRKLPNVSETSPALGRHSVLGYETQKMCENLHRPLVRAYVVSSRPRASKLDGPDALLKFFLKRGSDPIFDKKHLERYGRPDAVDIKLRWAPAS